MREKCLARRDFVFIQFSFTHYITVCLLACITSTECVCTWHASIWMWNILFVLCACVFVCENFQYYHFYDIKTHITRFAVKYACFHVNSEQETFVKNCITLHFAFWCNFAKLYTKNGKINQKKELSERKETAKKMKWADHNWKRHFYTTTWIFFHNKSKVIQRWARQKLKLIFMERRISLLIWCWLFSKAIW